MAFDPCVIQPATLRHSIVIQAPSTTRDASGQQGVTWTTVLTTRAAIGSTASLTFKLSFQGNILASNATDLIALRYPAVNIKPGYQVVYGTQVYTINAVDDVQRRHRVLNLACTGMDISSQ